MNKKYKANGGKNQLRLILSLFLILQGVGQNTWAGPHPADTDNNFLMSLNESTNYGFCWRSAPTIPSGCPNPAAMLGDAVRAGTIWNSTVDGKYYYDSTKTCPLCWAPGTTPTKPGQLQWAKAQPCSVGSAFSAGIASDLSGNVFIGGWFNGTVDFGKGPISSTGGSGLPNGFLLKYTPQGVLDWARTMGGDNSSYVNAFAIDSTGNIIVVGRFAGMANLGRGDVASRGAENGFAAKYNPDGSCLWAKTFGGANSDAALAVAVDGTNNVFFISRTTSINADYGGVILNATGQQNTVVAKLSSSSGGTLWAQLWGGSGYNQPNSVAVDRWNDVVVVGYFTTATNLGAGLVSSSGGIDMFLAKYSGLDGGHRWSKQFGSTGGEIANGVATDPTSGNIVMTGSISTPFDFGGGVIQSPLGGGGVFLAGYDPLGNYLWAVANGGSGDYGAAVAVSPSGGLGLTGRTTNAINFGVWPTDPWEGGYGSPNYFVVSFSINGNSAPVYRWQKVNDPGTSGGNKGMGVALDDAEHLLTSGSFQGTFIISGTSLVAPAGTVAGFAVKYDR